MLLTSLGILVPVGLGIAFLLSLPITFQLTKNSTKLRRNFYVSITVFVFQCLLAFSSVTMPAIKPPAPIELDRDTLTLEDTNRRIVELHRYTEDVERYLEFTTTKFYLLVGALWFFSLFPWITLGFNFIRHLEKSDADDTKSIF